MTDRIPVCLIAGSMDGGGSERQTLLLLRHLDRTRFQPRLLLLYRRGVLLPEVPDDVPIAAYWDSAASPRLRWPGRIHQRQVRWLREELRAIPGRPIVYDRTYHSTLIAGPATQPLSVPRISTIVAPPKDDLSPKRERFVWLKRRRLAKAYRESYRVVAVSGPVARAAESFYHLPACSVQVIHNALDLDRVRQLAATPCPAVLPENSLHIICAGRMSAEKGQADLIGAFSRLDSTLLQQRRVHLWLAGDGPLRGELERQAQISAAADRIHFTGHLTNLPALLARSQLVCIPSHYEGLPNVALEALALGVPVVATDVGGTPEVIRATAAGRLVAARDPAALTDALRMAIETPLPAPQPKELTAFALPEYLEQVESLLLEAAEAARADKSA